MRSTFLILFISFMTGLQAQSSIEPVKMAGNYSAMVSGERITLIIERKAGSSYTGVLDDGYQSLNLALELAGTTFSGMGTEPSTGIEIGISGEIEGDQLLFNLIVDPLGEVDDVVINFTRDGLEHNTITGTNVQAPSSLVFPSGATHPEEMLGTWTKEELYQSGYGDSYMGAGSSQSMTFLADGHMADAGSSSYISGSDYSGQSSGQGAGVIPGVAWYTIGNQLYMQVIENGQSQDVHLGRYYVENNNMLITGTNGEKILLSRQ